MVVIRGIDLKYTDEDLRDMLKMPCTRMFSATSNSHTRSIRCECPDKETKDKLLKSGYEFAFRIHKVEDYRSQGPRQCFKCQEFGHLARDCTAAQRCKNCGEDHRHTECSKTTEDHQCSNCQGSHPSTFRGCPAYQEAKKDQVQQQLTYAQKTAKPAPTIETVRLAATIAEALYLCLSEHIAGLQRETIHQTVNGVVSSIYRRPVTARQTTHISTV